MVLFYDVHFCVSNVICAYIISVPFGEGISIRDLSEHPSTTLTTILARHKSTLQRQHPAKEAPMIYFLLSSGIYGLI